MSGSNPPGSAVDMAARLKMVLPAGWFADATPVLDQVLGGLGALWAGLYALIGAVRRQTRIATASGPMLDIAARDYLGGRIVRRAGEADAAFSMRIRANLLAPKATRAALAAAITAETGRAPAIFEPANTGDTGGYGANTLGYGARGGYGSLALPYQCFVTAYRPLVAGSGASGGFGYGPGGYSTSPLAWSDLAQDVGLATDADIYATIAGVLPVNAIAWTRLLN
ncbi:hypothetical protein [Acidiphilium multivorum]|uniref:hypothetical protein n=1 Tax=Acidiphilium multivorum TaxID=62140 RepID=UPI001B8BB783|nr:hypothetical protein [Acidiphilium multivorum]MBS3022995.1 hypothetical protein [Acidiphilium multivorum]